MDLIPVAFKSSDAPSEQMPIEQYKMVASVLNHQTTRPTGIPGLGRTFNVGAIPASSLIKVSGGKRPGEWIASTAIKDPSGRPPKSPGKSKRLGRSIPIQQNRIIFGGTSQVNVHALGGIFAHQSNLGRGLLNNPDIEHLFSALPHCCRGKGTPGFSHLS